MRNYKAAWLFVLLMLVAGHAMALEYDAATSDLSYVKRHQHIFYGRVTIDGAYRRNTTISTIAYYCAVGTIVGSDANVDLPSILATSYAPNVLCNVAELADGTVDITLDLTVSNADNNLLASRLRALTGQCIDANENPTCATFVFNDTNNLLDVCPEPPDPIECDVCDQCEVCQDPGQVLLDAISGVQASVDAIEPACPATDLTTLETGMASILGYLPVQVPQCPATDLTSLEAGQAWVIDSLSLLPELKNKIDHIAEP